MAGSRIELDNLSLVREIETITMPETDDGAQLPMTGMMTWLIPFAQHSSRASDILRIPTIEDGYKSYRGITLVRRCRRGWARIRLVVG